jgi:hypothetical protein
MGKAANLKTLNSPGVVTNKLDASSSPYWQYEA